jgi:UDP-N-acetyl-D-glucosamine dehydrogenase
MPASTSRTDTDRNSAAECLRAKINDRSAIIGIVGLGYVGLPLAHAIHKAGFRVLGFDVDQRKIDALGANRPYIKHLEHMFEALHRSDRFMPTSDAQRLGEADAVLLCVPTPLTRNQIPDLTYVLDSTRLVARTLRGGQLIILESTTYPGTTRGDMLPILEQAGRERSLVAGRDFFLAYSPEREDPGSPGRSASDIPKVVGGVDDVSTDLAAALYQHVAPKVHRVSSAEVAETSKLLENIFRAVNIALVNELKTVLTEMGIDIWEVIAASATKPFGYMPFYPGPGLGGHCIPIDPFYLTWKAREFGRHTRFIELAGEINRHMPEYVVEQLAHALNDDGKPMKGAKVLIIGIAYKPNVDDIRESPAAEIIELLGRQGASVSYHDPHCPVFPKMRHYSIDLASVPLTAEACKAADAVFIVTNHDTVDYELIGRSAKLVVDSRNAMARVDAKLITARVVKA